MKQEIKQRIVGAIIFVIFISTMVPPILDGRNSSENKSNEVLVSSNQFNEKERKVIEIDLERGVCQPIWQVIKKNTYIDRFKEYISTFSSNEISEQKKIQDSNIVEQERASVNFDEFEDVMDNSGRSFMELENARNQIANLRDIEINAYVIEDIKNNQSSYKVRTGINLSEKAKEISKYLEKLWL